MHIIGRACSKKLIVFSYLSVKKAISHLQMFMYEIHCRENICTTEQIR